MQLSPVHLQIYSSRTFRRFPCSSPLFSMVPAGFPWLSTIQKYVKSFTHLQLSYPSFAKIFCRRGQIKWPWGNQGSPAITKGIQWKPSEREPAIVQIYTTSIEEFIRITSFVLKRLFRGTLANFCKIKKCIIFITVWGLKSQNLTWP